MKQTVRMTIKCENGTQKQKQKNQWDVVKQEENTPNDYEHYGRSNIHLEET